MRELQLATTDHVAIDFLKKTFYELIQNRVNFLTIANIILTTQSQLLRLISIIIHFFLVAVTQFVCCWVLYEGGTCQ